MVKLSEISKTQKIIVMVGTMLALLLGALDQTIVATAMPRIVQDLHGLEHLSWVITAYLLASTIVVPLYGKMSDLYGRKYFMLVGIFVFLLGSALSGLSQDMTQLIVFRFIQGLGSGAIFANAFAVIGDLFPPAERGRWQGLFGAVFGLASVIGPALGGFLTDNFSWRWNFYINLPVGILALLVVGFLMPHIVHHESKEKLIDWRGSLMLAIGLASLLLALTLGGTQFAWDSLQEIVLIASSVVSLISFGIIESKVPEPVLPLTLFKNKIFTVSILITFLTGFGMFGAILYVPLFAQLVLGVTATNSGTILTPLTLSMVVASVFAGQIIARFGKYKFLAIGGMFISALAFYFMSLMDPRTTQGELVLRMIATGVGLGVSFPIFTLAVQNAFDHSKLGVVTASTQLFRSIGATVGTAIMGGVLNNGLASRMGDLSSDPFLQMVSKINPQVNIQKIDANTLAAFLTGPGRQMAEQQINQLPPAMNIIALTGFNNFVNKTKEAFAASITEVFLIGAIVMALAFVASFFLPEIPLRKTHEGWSEVGRELADEEAIIPASDEPEL